MESYKPEVQGIYGQNDWYENDLEPFMQEEKAHQLGVETLCFNPQNSNELITGAHDKLIKLWDVNKLKTVSVLQGHQAGVWATSFSHDGKILMSASPDKTIMLWDVKKKKPTHTLKEHKNKIYYASFNENSKLIASGGEDQRLIIWDLRKGSCMKIINSNTKVIYNVKWSKCGKFLFTTEYGGVIKAYDTQKFELLHQYGKFKEENRAWTCDMDFRDNSKSENKVFVGYEEQNLKVLSFDKKEAKFNWEYEFLAHLDPIKCLTLNAEKRVFATGCRDGSARIWSLDKKTDQLNRTRHITIANLVGHKDNVSCIEFAPNTKGPLIMASCSWDQSLQLYKL